jgi:xylose isomerase
VLETSGYDGPRHFDAHAYRSEDPDGVWDFAAGYMRTYLALAAKSRQFLASDAIRAAREASRVDELAESSVGPYSASAASELLAEDHDLDALAGHGYGVERLDQLVVELLLGAGAAERT